MAERILQDIAEQKIRLTKAQITKNRVEEVRITLLSDIFKLSCCNLGNNYHSLGDDQQALEYHKQHWSIVNKVGDHGEGERLRNLALIIDR